MLHCCCWGSKANWAWLQWLCYECLRPRCFVFLLFQLIYWKNMFFFPTNAVFPSKAKPLAAPSTLLAAGWAGGFCRYTSNLLIKERGWRGSHRSVLVMLMLGWQCLAVAKRIFLSGRKYIGSSSKKSLGCSSGRQLVPRYSSGDLHTGDRMGCARGNRNHPSWICVQMRKEGRKWLQYHSLHQHMRTASAMSVAKKKGEKLFHLAAVPLN